MFTHWATKSKTLTLVAHEGFLVVPCYWKFQWNTIFAIPEYSFSLWEEGDFFLFLVNLFFFSTFVVVIYLLDAHAYYAFTFFTEVSPMP